MTLLVSMFWFDHPILLKFHNNDIIRISGLLLCYFGLALYIYSQIYLGKNYSPCFDSYRPFAIVENGPY